jgi:DNA replication initiation complex subunit (GINS family)
MTYVFPKANKKFGGLEIPYDEAFVRPKQEETPLVVVKEPEEAEPPKVAYRKPTEGFDDVDDSPLSETKTNISSVPVCETGGAKESPPAEPSPPSAEPAKAAEREVDPPPVPVASKVLTLEEFVPAEKEAPVSPPSTSGVAGSVSELDEAIKTGNIYAMKEKVPDKEKQSYKNGEELFRAGLNPLKASLDIASSLEDRDSRRKVLFSCRAACENLNYFLDKATHLPPATSIVSRAQVSKFNDDVTKAISAFEKEALGKEERSQMAQSFDKRRDEAFNVLTGMLKDLQLLKEQAKEKKDYFEAKAKLQTVASRLKEISIVWNESGEYSLISIVTRMIQSTTAHVENLISDPSQGNSKGRTGGQSQKSSGKPSEPAKSANEGSTKPPDSTSKALNKKQRLAKENAELKEKLKALGESTGAN